MKKSCRDAAIKTWVLGRCVYELRRSASLKAGASAFPGNDRPWPISQPPLSPPPYRPSGVRLSARLDSVRAWAITRLAGMGDIRAIGSGNIGATNVLRTGNKDARRADPARRRRQGCRRRADRQPLRPRRRPPPPGSVRFLAISIRSGSASRAARALPPISACSTAFAWPAGPRLRRDLAGGRLPHPLFLALGADSPPPRRRSCSPACWQLDRL